MGKVILMEETTKNPITLMGKIAGICWGADITDKEKNYKRGLDCLKNGHWRLLENPQVYMIIEGYSARFMRELYTHIGGAPTRLQASTRYIEYGKFDYITPSSVSKNAEAKRTYNAIMEAISAGYKYLEELGVPKEDTANILPLGMESMMFERTNPRNLIDMSRNRLCSRAYWEFRLFMKELMKELSEYSEEWKYIIDNYFKPKCEVLGYCEEEFSCGRKPQQH